jgi:hypothetical protein
MTRQDRDLAIADNLAYTAAVLNEVAREWATDGRADGTDAFSRATGAFLGRRA